MVRSIYELIIPLLTAHFIGDFLIQSDEDIWDKARLIDILKHSLIIGILSYALLGFLQAWAVGLFVFLSHGAIDYVVSKQTKRDLKLFLIDQSAHLLVIGLIVYIIIVQETLIFPSYWVQLFGNGYYAANLLVLGLIISVWVAGKLVGYRIKPFLDQIKIVEKRMNDKGDGLIVDDKSRGFENGGKTIGYLERALIYAFDIFNQPAGIGFLIAAKSVFRFGELSDRSNRMEAEYIIIGTLYSFLYGILVSYAISLLLSYYVALP